MVKVIRSRLIENDLSEVICLMRYHTLTPNSESKTFLSYHKLSKILKVS